MDQKLPLIQGARAEPQSRPSRAERVVAPDAPGSLRGLCSALKLALEKHMGEGPPPKAPVHTAWRPLHTATISRARGTSPVRESKQCRTLCPLVLAMHCPQGLPLSAPSGGMTPFPIKQNPELPKLAKGEDPGEDGPWCCHPQLGTGPHPYSCLAECRLGHPLRPDWRPGRGRNSTTMEEIQAQILFPRHGDTRAG